ARPRWSGVGAVAAGPPTRPRRYRGAVAQFHRLDAALADDARGLGFEAHGDALGFDRALEYPCRARIELALHQPVHEMEHGDVGARLGESIGGLETEEAATDDDDARTRRFRDGVDVVDVAEGEHARQVHSGHGELH